jgi:hypothetical protein
MDLHPMNRLRDGKFNHLNPSTNTFVNKKLSNPTLDAIPVLSRAKRDTRILTAPRLSGRTPPRLGLLALAAAAALLAAAAPLNRAGRPHRNSTPPPRIGGRAASRAPRTENDADA